MERLLGQGELIELINTAKLLLRYPSRAPNDQLDKKPGQDIRDSGEEPLITYVPLLLRPFVMDCTRTEPVHLGENVTLSSLQIFYRWIGVAFEERK